MTELSRLKVRGWTWIVCVLLAGAALISFWPALHCGFVDFDDPAYVSENIHVRNGLTWSGVGWAFTTGQAENWHPVTWLSHMADVNLYGGLRPSGIHLTNVLLHIANSILLFLLLNRLSRALWPSAFVAAIFALHPLRVESVVWISERKDVLSSFFFLLTVWAYARYAAIKSRSTFAWYGAALVFYALGLMSKPMLVTLPAILLLLDYWPLRRIPPLTGRVLIEKLPFLGLSVADCVITMLVQKNALVPVDRWPVVQRIASTPLAYADYLGKNFWPSALSSFYPHPTLQVWPALGAFLLLLALTAAVVRWRSRRYLAVGWFWFLIMLLPVIGLVQAGGQFIADRYTYLSTVGLWIMIAWAVRDVLSRWPAFVPAAAAGGVFVAAAFAVMTWLHSGIYTNTGTLWNATLQNDPGCVRARVELAKWLLKSGRYDEAFAQCETVLQLAPGDPRVESLLAQRDLRAGRFGDAAQEFQHSLALDPDQPEAWCNLGFAWLHLHHVPEATRAYEKALELSPDYALAHNDLGNILLQSHQLDAALEHFRRAAEIWPDFAEPHYNMGEILLYQKHPEQALAEYRKALELKPGLAPARAKIAAILRQQGR